MIKAALLLSLGAASLGAQSRDAPSILPDLAGLFPIGRVTYHWIDSSRAAFVDPAAAARRELMVDVWYPATSNGARARAGYFPNLATLRRALKDSVLRRQFAPAYDLIEAGRLTTHAREGVPAACPENGCPLLVFSHGGGVDRSFYSAQYEDLASHGYIVVAIAHSFDSHIVVFPNGRAVRSLAPPPDTVASDSTLPRWRREFEAELRSQVFVRRVIEVEANDIRYVVGMMSRLERGPRGGAPFAHKVDLTRIGALGHSAGGEAAALACQLDARIKACVDQDGVMNNMPFIRDAGGLTMKQPFLYLGRVTDLRRQQMSDSALAVVQMTRAELDSIVRVVTSRQDDLLTDMPGGAYRVLLKMPGVSHMSFSDEPLLNAHGDTLATSNALAALSVIEEYTRAFFDKTLRGLSDTALDGPTTRDAGAIVVERFVVGRAPVRP